MRPRWALAACGAVLLVGVTFGSWAAQHGLYEDTAQLRKAARHSQVDEVCAECEAVLARRPADYYPALVAARALAETARFADTLHWINRVQYLNPSSPQGHELAARVLRRMGLHGQAMIEWKLAAQVSGRALGKTLDRAYRTYRNPATWRRMTPRESEAQRILGRRLLRRKEYAEALAVSTDWLAEAPEDYPGLMVAQAAAAALGRVAEAREFLEQALRVSPDEVAPHLGLVNLATTQDERRAALERGLTALPGEAQLTRQLFKLQLRIGELDAAQALAEQLRRRAFGDRRRSALAQDLLGQLELARGNLFQAIRRYRQAVELAPRPRHYRLILARLYERSEQFALAQAEYQTILARQPKHGVARRRLEALERKVRDVQDARRLEALQREDRP